MRNTRTWESLVKEEMAWWVDMGQWRQRREQNNKAEEGMSGLVKKEWAWWGDMGQ